MNSAITRTSLILAALALVFLMPATCHAQAEVSPDCYAIDNATSNTNSQMALASQPASVSLTQPQVYTAAFVTLNSSAQFDHTAGLDALRRMRTATVAYLRRLSDFMARHSQTSALAQIS